MWFSEKIVSLFSPEEMHILEARFKEGQTWLLLCSEEELRQELRDKNDQKKEIIFQKQKSDSKILTSYTRAREILGDDDVISRITTEEVIGRDQYGDPLRKWTVVTTRRLNNF